MRTPWGNSESLRERRLRPTAGVPPDEVATNQRERLFAALVASVAGRGYEKTRIADVAQQAGVGQRNAYELFGPSPKRECFLAAVDELYKATVDRVSAAHQEEEEWEARLRAGLTALLELIADQPAAAHASIVGIYEVGQPGSARVQVGLALFDGFVTDAFAECPRRAALPEEVIAALVGALHMLIHDRLRRDQAAELPGMADDMLAWVLSYEAPGVELRGGVETTLPAVERTGTATERLEVAMAQAVCEHGYQATTARDLVARAQTSLATLYDHFHGKEGLFLAAFDRLTGRALEVSEGAFAVGGAWPRRMQAVNRDLFAYLASEPELTRLSLVEVMGAGSKALAARDEMLKPFGEKLMGGGYALAPEAPKIAEEACALAVYAAAGRWIEREGARSLAALVPLATFIELAPFLGSSTAADLAAGDAPIGEVARSPDGRIARTPSRT